MVAVAVKTNKRRPVARTRDTQEVNLHTIASLHAETTVEAYHSLFMNIEILMGTVIEHGVHDEVITIINSARLAQHVRVVSELDKYLAEVTAAAIRFNEETDRTSRKAEADRYSPEATVRRLRDADSNPARLKPPAGGALVTLSVTARLSNSLLASSQAILKAEQVYGAFWTFKARCFVVRRGTSAATAFLAYMAERPKAASRGYRLLTEYKLVQSTYRNAEIYMLVDLPRLVALQDTKIMELSISTRAELQVQDAEDRLPIIQKAELIVSRLPKTVSADSKRYMVNRLVEGMLLDDKKLKLQTARYGVDGPPRQMSAAAALLTHQRIKIIQDLAAMIDVPVSDMQKAVSNKRFSEYVGTFVRMHGAHGWQEACAKVREWKRLKALGTIGRQED